MIIEYTKTVPDTQKQTATTNEKINVGTVCLPINLNSSLKRALEYLNRYIDSPRLHSNGILYNNNKNKSYNNIIIYYTNRVQSYTTAEDKMKHIKETAKQLHLVDYHFMPIKCRTSDENKHNACVCYNMDRALVSMFISFGCFKQIINQYIKTNMYLTDEDVHKTIESVASELTDSITIKNKAIDYAYTRYRNNKNEYLSLIDYCDNIETILHTCANYDEYLNYKTGYSNELSFRISEYGYKDCAFRTITHKIDDNIYLYIDKGTLFCLKQIKKSMTGYKFHSYMNDILGDWFDTENKKTWNCIRKMIETTDESFSATGASVEMYKEMVKLYIEKMKPYYNVNEEAMPIIKENLVETIEQHNEDQAIDTTIENEDSGRETCKIEEDPEYIQIVKQLYTDRETSKTAIDTENKPITQNDWKNYELSDEELSLFDW